MLGKCKRYITCGNKVDVLVRGLNEMTQSRANVAEMAGDEPK
ncbi:MAG: hypothetical protein WCP52_04055 [Bacteroidota bacterium]